MKAEKEKKPVWSKKTSAQKTTKIFIFSKGLVHGSCQTMENFECLVFMQNGSIRRDFFVGCVGKEAFLDHKKTGSKKNTKKLAFFSKGFVHGFCQKMEIF